MTTIYNAVCDTLDFDGEEEIASFIYVESEGKKYVFETFLYLENGGAPVAYDDSKVKTEESARLAEALPAAFLSAVKERLAVDADPGNLEAFSFAFAA